MKTYRWKLEGECCPHCAEQIAERLKAMDGVAEAQISVLSGRIKVKAEDAQEDKLFAATESLFQEIEPTARPLR